MVARNPALRLYQARVLLALAHGVRTSPGATFTVLFPRQAGKNEVAAVLVAYLLSANAARGGTVVVCAPSFAPQAEISIARVRRALDVIAGLFPGVGRAVISGHAISVGLASAVFLSASPEAHVAGHTASLALVADEAQEIDETWFNRQFRPMAASTGAPTVLFGTPWDGDSLLDRAVAANRLRDLDSSRTVRLHYQTGWREVALSNPRYGAYVESERARLGAGHPLFLTQYELQTVAAAGRLLSPADLALMEGAYPRLGQPLPGEVYVAGLDLGGDGSRADASVLTIARVIGDRCEVVEHRAWKGAAYGAVETGVAEAVNSWRLRRICVDTGGLGSVLAAHLHERCGDVVERVVFSASSKSEMGYALIAAARTGRLALYAADGAVEALQCREELRIATARFLSAGRLRWEAPPGSHDDYVASLALCIRAAGAVPPPRLATGRRRPA